MRKAGTASCSVCWKPFQLLLNLSDKKEIASMPKTYSISNAVDVDMCKYFRVQNLSTAGVRACKKIFL